MESLSRLSGMLEQARDLTLDAAREASLNLKTTRSLPTAQIRRMLDSRIEREVTDGLRKVIAMQYTAPLGATLPFFPAVLKTLSNPTPLTRSLVYAYLTYHAEADADTALLSINTIQKSFSDANPRVRALALRTMSGLRVPVISQIVSLAIKRALTDASPVVRKTAAFACVKCVRLDPRTSSQITEYLDRLLGDQQYYVVGAAIVAFAELCPDREDLLHKHYRSIVKKLVDMDEWGQLATLRVLTVYARKCFPYRSKRVRRTESVAAHVTKKSALSTDEFYADDGAEAEVPTATATDRGMSEGDYEDRQVLDPDLEMLLDTAEPLLQARNSAVIIAVVRAYLYLAPTLYLARAIASLIALLRGPEDVRETCLHNILQVCIASPTLLAPYYRHFLLSTAEGLHISRLKLELLTLIFPHCEQNVQLLILAELDHCSRTAARSDDRVLVREAVGAIGRCAQASSASASVLARCTRILLEQLHCSSPDREHGRLLVTEALEVVRHLIQRDAEAHGKTVIRLAKSLDTLVAPTARASVIWLVGEYAASDELEASIAPDVLRILLKGYVDETDLVREQIILLAAKVYLHWLTAERERRKRAVRDSPPEETSANESRGPIATAPIEQLFNHALLLARYTPSYDVRDRARLFRALLRDPDSTDLASLLLLAPKAVPSAAGPSETRRTLLLGSSTLVLGPGVADPEGGAGPGLKGYADLPDWVPEGREPDPRLRDVEPGGAQMPAAKDHSASRKLDEAVVVATQSVGDRTLDKWLDEDESEESPEEESSEEESSEGESEDESEDHTEDESEDESEEDIEDSKKESGPASRDEKGKDRPTTSSEQRDVRGGPRGHGSDNENDDDNYNDDDDDGDRSGDGLIGGK